MQISNIINAINNQLNNNSPVSKESNTTEVLSGKISEGEILMNSVKPGQVFEGSVLSVLDGRVVIDMGNGNTLNARLDSGVNLTEGLATFFEVKSNENGKVALKVFSQDNSANPTLIKALYAAGIDVSERNLETVKTMMQEQMPIDKKNLQSMIRVSNTFMETPVKTLLSLSKLNVDITRQNIEQLEHYEKGEGHVEGNLEKISGKLSALVTREPDMTKALKLHFAISDILTDKAALEDGSLKTEAYGDPSEERAFLKEAGTTESAANEAKSLTLPNGELAEGEKADLIRTENQSLENMKEAGKMPEEGDPERGQTVNSGGRSETSVLPAENGRNIVLETNLQDVSQKAQLSDNPERASVNSGEEVKDNRIMADSILPSEESFTSGPKGFLKALTESGLGEKEMLKKLDSYLKESSLKPEELKEVFSSKEYSKIISKLAEKQWFIEPEKLSDKEALKELYNRMDRQMARLQDLLSQTGNERSQLSSEVNEVRSNISFQNEINQFYNYVQIPLKMTNQNATGDLYVYTNKKGIRNNKDELTAHLHLEMEHLGTTDVYVKLRNQNVTTNFMLADEESLRLVEDHISELTDRLNNKGYNVTTSVTEKGKEEPGGFVSEILEQNNLDREIYRYSFDAKV